MVDVFDLTGPEFLQFYFFLTLICFAIALFLRWIVRTPAGLPRPIPQLSPMEIALLSGSPKGVAYAVLAGLVYRGVLSPEPGRGRLERIAPSPSNAEPLEDIIAQDCAENGTRLNDLCDCVKPYTTDLRKQLEPLKLILSDGNRALTSLIPLLVIAGLLLIGVVKIVVGISRNKPVELLVFFTAFNVLIGGLLFARPEWRTRRGSALLREIQNSQSALKISVLSRGSVLAYDDIVLAFAIFGPAILAGSDPRLRDLGLLIKPVPAWSFDGGSGGCSSGSGCSGGGACGGGGGGGSSCGGCGGGGH